MTLQEISGRYAITVPEAGKMLGLGRAAAYAAAKRGEIPVLRIGRRMLVPVSKMLAMLGLQPSDRLI